MVNSIREMVREIAQSVNEGLQALSPIIPDPPMKYEVPHKRARKILKIKLKSLASEVRIIQHEERRTTDKALRLELVQHRRTVVREESRATHIAYAYLRGQTLARVERKALYADRADHDRLIKKVSGMVQRYGDPGAINALPGWLRGEAEAAASS